MKVSKRLEMAFRRNEGKKLLPEYLEAVSQNLGRSKESIRLLALDETDILRAAFDAKLSSCSNSAATCFRKTWRIDDLDSLKRLISKLKQQVPDTPIVLLRNLDEYCGAVETTSQEVLDHAFQLVSLNQEALMAASTNASTGFLLSFDTNKYETGNVEAYELCVWGDEWLRVLTNESEGQPITGHYVRDS